MPVQECKHKNVWLADGKQYTVRSYVESTVRVGNLVESIELAVIPLSDFDVIVGTPWLTRHNPSINWITSIVTVNSNGNQCVLPLHNQSDTPVVEMVSALQFKREVAKGEQVYLVVIQVPALTVVPIRHLMKLTR